MTAQKAILRRFAQERGVQAHSGRKSHRKTGCRGPLEKGFVMQFDYKTFCIDCCAHHAEDGDCSA